MLADDVDAEELYQAGLGMDLTRWPWPRTRLELAYGSWLRRQRRVAESRPYLRSAQRTLEAIGATCWAEEARRELRAAGVRPEANRALVLDALSPQKRQIAELAAGGLSNREIGARLFLSRVIVNSCG